LEIKWSNRAFEYPGELKSLLTFCEANKLKSALVTTLDKEGSKKIYELNIHFLPSALYAYSIGNNTILQKQKRG
jgi:hypothetical protein